MANPSRLVWASAILLGCSHPEPTAQHLARVGTPATSPASAATRVPADGKSSATEATAGASSASSASAEPTIPKSIAAPTASVARCELLAIGDSITDPNSAGGGYLEAVRKSCGCQVTNLGKGGDMVNQMRARLLAHLAESPVGYRFVVVFGGVNDLYSDLTAKRSVEKISADLEKMYRAARATGARVIAVTVAPWGGFRRYFTEHRWQNTRRLNDWIRDTPSRGLTDAVVDAESLLSCGAAERLCAKYAAPFRDGLHFGPEGHRRLSRALAQALGATQCERLPDHGPDND